MLCELQHRVSSASQGTQTPLQKTTVHVTCERVDTLLLDTVGSTVELEIPAVDEE